MNKPTISRNQNGSFLTVAQACEEFNLSRNLLLEIAGNANAVCRPARRTIRIDRERLTEYLRNSN